MKKLFLIFSLFLISCGTKTETQVQAEQIQQQAKAEMNTLPVPQTDSIPVQEDTAYVEGSHDDLIFFENDSNIIPRSEFK